MASESFEEAPDRIAATLNGRDVLLTGGTGFLGKVFVEKFLRLLPDINQLYLLVRAKKGKDPKHRLDDIFNSAFKLSQWDWWLVHYELSRVLAENENTNSFVTVTEVDKNFEHEQSFGMCRVHRRIKKGFEVFEYYANNQWDFENSNIAELRSSLNAKERVLYQLHGDDMQLDDYFESCLRACRIYILNEPPETLPAARRHMRVMYWVDVFTKIMFFVLLIYMFACWSDSFKFDELLKRAVILNTRGTKLMLELAKEMKKLDLFVHISTAYCHLEEKVIFSNIFRRPSIVIPIWKEPVPGWTDNLNGPTGLLIGAGKGVIRTMHCNQNSYADYVPVDIAVNAILAITWNYLGNAQHDKRVYNLTSSSEFKVSWAEIIDIGRRVTEKVPLNGVVWYPGGSMKKSRFVHNMSVLFFHMIPAYIIDALIFLAGHKPIMCRVHRRIKKGFEVFEYYANNQWDFENSNIAELRSSLNAKERVLYQLHGDDMQLDDYFESCLRACRIYILNEPPETLPAARRHMRVMYWVDVFTKIMFFVLLIYMFACWSDSFKSLIVGSWKILDRALTS
ncbi:fatty acyl-CoA reductase wat-like [Copidosoma floridanum]|uniref:fatty acyl-CoA reductase wat-like n=1 Tax=Copidosoma floridanum TaxID=29053 RepID=UPI000C6F99D0|nr:fatty acyl-CoA reductase wat-like [Copidosoma floridanum]